MKTLLIAVLCLSCLGGCSKDKEDKEEIKKSFQQNITTVVIDGCEYLMFIDTENEKDLHRGYGYAGLTHKGNCRFCEQRHAQK